MNCFLVLSDTSDFGVSSPSRATRSPPLRRWFGTADPSTTGRCQSPTSPSPLRASSRSSLTPCSSTRPWWGLRYPTPTPPPWWSSRSRGTSPTTQVRDYFKCWFVGICALNYSGKSLFSCQSVIISEMDKDVRRGWRLLSLPIIRAGDLVRPGACAGHHFLWCFNRKEGAAGPGHNPKSALPRLSDPFSFRE